MKICDIIQSYGPKSGGVKRYLINKMRYFSRSIRFTGGGHFHVAIVPSHRDAMRIEYATRIYEVKSPYIPGSADYRLLMKGKRIQRIIEAESRDRERIDLIEVDSAYISAWIGVREARRFGIPIVAFYHSDFPRNLGEKLERLHPKMVMDAIARGVTKRTREYLQRLYGHMDATVVATRKYEAILEDMGIGPLARIPLGVNIYKFYPRNSRKMIFEKHGLSDDTRLLLYVGRLAEMKQIDALLEMMSRLSRSGERFQLIIIGEGELRDVVAAAASSRGDVTWLSYTNSQEVLARYYSAADLFVHAGTMETFGLVSLEAQACGTRVIGVKGGGMEETLEGESPLIMASPGASPGAHPGAEDEMPERLAEAVLEATALDEGQEKRDERRQRIVENFSWDSTFRKMVALYEGLVDRG